MSFMTERKAKELFSQYMQAEASGNDTLAIQLERDLNNAGWYITSGPDGLTIAKKESPITSSDFDWSFAPKESTIAPNPSNDNPNGKVWRTVTIAVLIAIGVVLLVVTSVKIYQVIKNRKNAAT